MDPTTTCCPHLACPARGQTGQGTMGLHACKDKRCICTECPKPCSATQGTACERLRTSAETVRLVGTRLAHGCPLHALVVALGSDERTVAGWGARGGAQGQAVQEPLVEPPRAVGQGQAEEVRVKKQGAMVWMALARMVRTRLGRAGEGSAQPCHGAEAWPEGAGAPRGAAAPPRWAVPLGASRLGAQGVRRGALRGLPERRGVLGGAPGAIAASRRS